MTDKYLQTLLKEIERQLEIISVAGVAASASN
jgi:hypothetical protein